MIKKTLTAAAVMFSMCITVHGEQKETNIIFNEPLNIGWEILEQHTDPIWRFTDEEEELLARLMMAEAEGEGDIGKSLVLQVVLNRVLSNNFPDTVKEVVFEKKDGVCQFQPVYDGRLWEVVPDDVCYEILADIQAETYDNAQGATYFCEKNHNKWHESREYLFTYGNHNFYR